MVGFDFELVFHLVVGEPGVHFDGLGDHRRTGHSDRDVADAGAGLEQHTRQRLAHAFKLGDVFFDHRAGRQRLHRVGLDPIAVALTAELQKLHRRRADVDPQKRSGLFIEES